MIQSSFSTLEQWMLSFDLPSTSMPYAQYSSEDKKELQIVFTLNKTSEAGVFHFHFFKAKKLKHHQYGLLSEVSLEQIKKNATLSVSPRELDLIELIQWYKKHFQDANSPTYQHFQSFLFKELLSTGKLCWQGTFPMKITPASPQPLIFSWVTQKNGHKKLQLKINGINKNWCLAPGSELYYIDLDRYLSGPIETSLSRDQIEKFKQLPDIPPTELQKFCRFLRNNHDFHAIPFPEEITEKNIHVPPIPYLNIELTYQDQEPVAIAELFFLYDHYKVRPIKNAEEAKSNIYSFEEPLQLIDIHRHLLTERHYEQSLKAHDFQMNLSEKHSGIFLMKGEGISRFERENQFFLKWNTFETDSLPHLKTLHWKVVIHNNQLGTFHTPSKITISVDQMADESYSIDMSLIIGDQKIPFLDRLKKWLALSDSILNQKEMIETIDPETRVKIDTAEIAPFLLFLKETDYFEKEQPSFNLSAENVGFLQHVLLNAPEKTTTNIEWKTDKKLKQTLIRFMDFKTEEATLPQQFIGDLREYQKQGLHWLQSLCHLQFNGILADDMGLGKTVQTLAHLAHEKEANRLTKPALIVVPTSLMFNWKKESEKFTPNLRVVLIHGKERQLLLNQPLNFDLMITTYALLKRDAEYHLQQSYSFMILDEAQYIKNARSQNASVVKQIQAQHRLCLTGTPVENHLGELWSMFDFLMPKFLHSISDFNRMYRHPIEKEGSEFKRQYLVRKISPFLLRRTKEAVAPELPEKTECIELIEMQEAQRALYDTFKLTLEHKVKDLFAVQGLTKSRFFVLDALLKLRQICCHPRLLPSDIEHEVQDSGKLTWLLETLPTLIESGRRVLIFSQFVQMLNLIEDHIIPLNIPYSRLTGQTQNREEEIDKFQAGSTHVFLISLKAGGVGLNLTQADTVIHFDPWWNPQVENQATDRAHRIGQTKPVFVYKLVSVNSIEEKILILQEKKKHIAEAVFTQSNQNVIPVSEEEWIQLFE